MILYMNIEKLLELLLKAVLWGLFFYLIRRGLHPGRERADSIWKSDAFYGGLSIFLAGISYWVLKEYLL